MEAYPLYILDACFKNLEEDLSQDHPDIMKYKKAYDDMCSNIPNLRLAFKDLNRRSHAISTIARLAKRKHPPPPVPVPPPAGPPPIQPGGTSSATSGSSGGNASKVLGLAAASPTANESDNDTLASLVGKGGKSADGTSPGGHHYCLVVVDAGSRMCWCCGLRDLSGTTIEGGDLSPPRM